VLAAMAGDNAPGDGLNDAILASCRFPSNTDAVLTRDVRTITTVVTEVLAADPETTPLDIETALRAAAGQAYLVANTTTAGFEIVLGEAASQVALADRRYDRAKLGGAINPQINAKAGF
jgi:hypothetical protein